MEPQRAVSEIFFVRNNAYHFVSFFVLSLKLANITIFYADNIEVFFSEECIYVLQ